MKTLIALLLFVTVTTAAQQNIRVALPEDIDQTFTKVGRMLANEGYKLETIDRDLYLIATETQEKQFGFLGGGRAEVRFNFQFDEHDGKVVVNIRGVFRELSHLPTGEFQPIINRGARGSVLRGTWNVMYELAEKTGGRLSY